MYLLDWDENVLGNGFLERDQRNLVHFLHHSSSDILAKFPNFSAKPHEVQKN